MFEKSKIPFPEITMTLALEPFKSSIANIEVCIKELDDLKSECVLFSIFNVDMCREEKKEDVSKSKYPIKKPKGVVSPKRSEP